jgi:lysophospholipase L1-like esterase
MANKRMKTLQLPGLSDVYTFVQADSTLTQSGEAADAKATGDRLAAIEGATTVHPILLQGTDQYISIGTADQTVGEPTTRAGYQYAMIPCTPGELFLLESLAVEGGIRVWGFADSNKTLVRVTNGSTAAHQYITAPDDAAYLIVVNKTGDGTLYRGGLAPSDNQTRDAGSAIPSRHMTAAGNAYFNGAVTKIDFQGIYTMTGYTVTVSLLPCSPGDVFTINAHGGNYDRAWAFTKRDGTVVSAASGAVDLKNYQLTAPANAEYLLIQDRDGQTSYFGLPSERPATRADVDSLESDVEDLQTAAEGLEESVSEITDDLYNEPLTGWVTGTGYINTGISDLTQPVDLEHTYSGLDYRYLILTCAPGDTFILNVQGGGYPRAYAFLDSSNLILERADASVGLMNHVLTAPTGTAKLVLNDSSGLTSYYGEKSITYRVGELEALGAVPGKLTGKVMVNFGDSVFGRGQGATGISGRLAYKTGATVHNLGMSGTSFCTRTGVPGFDPFNLWRMADAITTDTWTDQDAAISQYQDRPGQAAAVISFLKTFDFSTVDYATIALGTNDWGGNYPLDNAEDKYDKGTVCGALRYSLETLLTAYPHTIFVILSTIPRFDVSGTTYTEKGANTAGYTLEEMSEALHAVADEYRLKFIDNFHIGFNKWTCPQYYATGEGTHPDLPGFEVMAENISANL